MSPDELKQKLIDIKTSGYSPGGVDVNGMLDDMMRNIGSVDSDLRENIYSALQKWTVKGVISVEQMKKFLGLCLDDKHLFYGIGENGTDSVFTRTFSVLLIPLAFSLNGRGAFLSENDVINIKENVIRYLRLENDVRGYVDGKGWAHSTAHASDALEDIARSEYIGRDGLLDILEAIKEKICIGYYTYVNEEDDRAAFAVLSTLERAVLTGRDITDWIMSFCSARKTGVYAEDLRLGMNVRNFLRSLYFMVYDKEGMQEIKHTIIAALK